MDLKSGMFGKFPENHLNIILILTVISIVGIATAFLKKAEITDIPVCIFKCYHPVTKNCEIYFFINYNQ